MAFRRLSAPIFALALACACAPGCSRAPDARSILILTLDTTRVDALGCYGGPPSLTPAIDALAREGVLYERAYTTTPLTLPSHASLMTGLYPLRHATRDNSRNPLPESAETLAERAAQAGFATAAVVGSAVLDPAQGLAQGFEHYDRVPRPSASTTSIRFAERTADQVLDRVRAWLDGHDPERRFLLWAHFFDPHFPYDPPPAYLQRAAGIPYEGEVAYTDAAIGALVDELRQRGLLDETLIVLIADHGEGLGQHGESTHGTLCYDSTMRVPLIVRDPSGERAGTRSREIVSVVDVFPTLLEAAGLGPADPELDGVSLWSGTRPPERGVYVESYYGYLQYGWSPLTGWIDVEGKYLHGPAPEFFDLNDDPDERRNRIADVDVRAYSEQIDRLAQRSALEVEATVDATLLDELRGLGYATVGSAAAGLPHPLAETGRPDVRARREEFKETLRAFGLGERGDHANAIAALTEIVAENPLNIAAQERLGTYLIARGQFADALVVLRDMLRLGYESGFTHNNVGHCLQHLGRNEEALTHFRRGLELDATNPMLPDNLALVLRRLGRADEAREYEALAAELRR